MSDPVKEKTLEPNFPDRLEDILYQYVNLYGLFREAQEAWVKKAEELSRLLESIQSAADRLEKIEDWVRKSLGAQLGSVIDVVKKEIVLSATEEVRKEVRKELKRMTVQPEARASDTKEKLENSFFSLKTIGWKWCLSTLCVGVLSSLLVTEWILPDLLIRMSDQRKIARSIPNDFIRAYDERAKKEKNRRKKTNLIEKESLRGDRKGGDRKIAMGVYGLPAREAFRQGVRTRWYSD